MTRVDRIGDVLLTTPVFPAIKARYPDSYVAALVLKGREPLVAGNPWIDEVIACEKRGFEGSWAGTFLFARRLRKKKFDIVVHLHATSRVYWISWLAGIPHRIGYKRKNHALLTHPIEDRKHLGAAHEAEYNFDPLKVIDVQKPGRLQLFFPLKNEDRDAIKKGIFDGSGKPYVVFHPSASCPSKIWPVEKMAALAERMSEIYGIAPVIVAGTDGIKEAQAMSARMTEKHHNLAGRLTLGMLGWVLKEARLVISNDSGPVHLACAVGTPVISIFGRNQAGLSPRRWGPIPGTGTYVQKDGGCVECLAHACRINFKCLEALTVEDLLEQVSRYEASFK